MREICINSKTHGKFIAMVDDLDYELVSKYKWHIQKGPQTFYAISSVNVNGLKGTLLMHRLIIKTSQKIDHRDGNGLNNQRYNLRSCTQKDNNRNSRPAKNNPTGFKGVSYAKDRKKYESKIMVNRKTIHLGRFEKSIDAAKAYNQAAIEHFGEFAWLNVL